MMQALFKGSITELKCKAGITKLTIETNAEKTKLDKIKLLLDRDVDIDIDRDVDIDIADNQTTLET